VLVKSTKCTFSKESQSNQKNYCPFNNKKWLVVDKIMSDNSSIDIADESKQILFKKPLGSKNDLVETMDMNFKISSTQVDKTCKGKLLVIVQAVKTFELISTAFKFFIFRFKLVNRIIAKRKT
jgi:hypothetical protein